MSIELQKRPGRDAWYLMGTEFGENIRESTGTADRKQAEVILARKRKEIFERHAYGAQATCTFLAAAQSYLEAGKGGREKRFLLQLLYNDYKAEQPQELTELAGKVLRAIDQSYLDTLVKTFPGVQPATLVRYVYTPITAVLTHASKRGLCNRPNFDRPEVGGGRIRWLAPVDAEKLAAACSDHFRPFVVFLIGTGCRLSEALYLDWREVNLDGGYVIIHGLTDDDDSEYQTKTGNVRTIPLSLRVLAELRKLAHRTGAVFRRPDGEPYARPDEQGRGGRHAHTALVGAAERAGLSHVHPHLLRHTFATWHSQMGTQVFRLMHLGGWSSPAMAKRYSHMEGMLSPADARIIATWLCGLEPHQAAKAVPALKLVGE